MIKQVVVERRIPPGTLTRGTGQWLRFHRALDPVAISALGVTHRRGGYRDPRVAGVQRELVSLREGALRLAQRVRDARPGEGGDRRLHRPLHDRPHGRLDHRTPREVRATWDDAQEALQKTAA